MINRYEELPLLLDFLNEYNKLFNDLNRKTYHNLQKSKKLSEPYDKKLLHFTQLIEYLQNVNFK